jgi:high-affinity Fe2+/Pb2+ permease
MFLILVLLLLVFAFGYGGLALSPLLWIVVALLLIGLFVGPGVSGAGWGDGRYRRW